MTEITVDVSHDNGTWTYKSSDDGVQEDGTITIDEGEDATITFVPEAGQTWTFWEPWIQIHPPNEDILFESGATHAVVIQDNNPKSPESEYEYRLHTTIGWADPRIINKGTMGMSGRRRRRGANDPIPPAST